MTTRRPRLGADSQELALAGFATVESLRMRVAMITIQNNQTVPNNTPTTVQFGNPPEVVYDTINIGQDLSISRIWNATAHAWVIPAEGRYVSFYGQVRYTESHGAGYFNLNVHHSRPSSPLFGRDYGFDVFYSNAAGAIPSLTSITPILEAEPGDQFSLITSHVIGVNENMFGPQFAIQFFEA